MTKTYQPQSSELQCKLALLIRAKNVARDKPAFVRVVLLALLQKSPYIVLFLRLELISGCPLDLHTWAGTQSVPQQFQFKRVERPGGSMVLKFNVDVELMADLAQAYSDAAPPFDLMEVVRLHFQPITLDTIKVSQ